MAFKISDRTLSRFYELRKEGHSDTHIIKTLAQEGHPNFNIGVYRRQVDSDENKERKDHHPKNIGAIYKRPMNFNKIFQMRNKGIADITIARRLNTTPKRIGEADHPDNKNHPSYVGPNKPRGTSEEIKNIIFKNHDKINPETGNPHTYGSLAKLSGTTRGTVAGLLSRKRGAIKEMSELMDRIRNVLSEARRPNKKLDNRELDDLVASFHAGETPPERMHTHLERIIKSETVHPEVKERAALIKSQIKNIK